MTITAVSRCAQCEAVVNIRWPSCLVCRATLPPVVATGSSEVIHENQGRAVEPLMPILPGWLVTYQDKEGRLSGGAEDRGHGTVQECRWDAGHWTVHLTNGQQVPLWVIRAVGQTDTDGRLLAAWEVRRHGYDGRKQEATS